ncbi:hypothetical protein ACFZC3_09160 [Streptomyces sp. NPDC007903]|uniref:hypothetical protein n=1 Tax=Streptomyces sp. NPDC007903 TaxID=3364786 RepID=UPI0036EABD4D
MRAEILPVTVAIRKKNRTATLYGSLTPTWTGTSWNGHCALVLPDSEPFVDPTIEQFDEVRAIGMGPMVGKVAIPTSKDGSLGQPGAQVMLQRADLVRRHGGVRESGRGEAFPGYLTERQESQQVVSVSPGTLGGSRPHMRLVVKCGDST